MQISFDPKEYKLNSEERQFIEEAITSTAQELRTMLPDLPDTIRAVVQFTDRDLGIVDGVTGRLDRHDPNAEMVIILSTSYPGGVLKAAEDGIGTVMSHELHHATRGWSMQNAHEHPRIISAVVSEGLAVVFAEKYTGRIQEGNQPPAAAASWIPEILALPPGANYSHWVSGVHPDGRTYIGYRAGKYMIATALQKSGLDIIELSQFSEQEILEHAGY